MAAAIASDSSSQLARLGLSEEEFKRKAELMRQYLQDNSGASSFEEFCKRQPTRQPDPPHRPPPQKPAVQESTKNSSSTSSKPPKPPPSFPPMGLPLPGGPLNSQMFGMMPPQLPHHVLPMTMPGAMPMPGMLPGQPMPYYPPMWLNPAGMVPGQPMNPWTAMIAPPPTLQGPQPTANINSSPVVSKDAKKEDDKEKKVTKGPEESVAKPPEPPSTPKTPKRKNADPSPFTPPAAAIFISPPGSDIQRTPITALLRPDGTFMPTPMFHPSPGIELMRPIVKQVIASEEIDPSSIFKLPSPPYATAKPVYSYAALIGQALNAAHRKRACLDHIYLYISTVYPYYKRGEQAWQNSIRHNLSQNSSFTRLKHPSGGQHGEWAIRDEDRHCFTNGGYVRAARTTEGGRKRRRKGAFDDDTDLEEDVSPRKRARKGRSHQVDEEIHITVSRDPSTPPDSTHPEDGLGSFHLPSRRDIMIRAKAADSQGPVEKQPTRRAQKSTGGKGTRKKGKKKSKARYESEEEEAVLSEEEEEESEFEGDVLSPLFGKGRPLKTALPIASLQPQKSTKEPDEEANFLDVALQSDVLSSRAWTASPPPDPVHSEPLSEAVSERGDPEEDEEEDMSGDEEESRPPNQKAFTKSPDYMERFLMERAQKERSTRSQERFRPVPTATLLNLSPMRGLSTTPMSSSIRGTGSGPSQRLDDVMSRFAINAHSSPAEESGGEESTHGREPEAYEEDERDRSVTPPPLIPNPPWMASPVPATPKNNKKLPDNGVEDEEDDDTLLSKPLVKHKSICISPNSSHLHQANASFMTPARATGSPIRPFDTSFSSLPRNSSPTRNPVPLFEPVTPDRDSSAFKSMFLQTPLFASAFSDSRLEEELSRMSRGDESPMGFFKPSDLYKSPSVPGSSPSRWAGH